MRRKDFVPWWIGRALLLVFYRIKVHPLRPFVVSSFYCEFGGGSSAKCFLKHFSNQGVPRKRPFSLVSASPLLFVGPYSVLLDAE